MAFADIIKDKMGKDVPNWIPRGKYRGKKYDHIFLHLIDNFIDGKYPKQCDIDHKGILMQDAAIKYHRGARHMNSSQAMCINFFNKFFEKPEYEQILLNILRNSGIVIDSTVQIDAAAFEYVPETNYKKEQNCDFSEREGTNFDFYMELSDGIRISIEVKYTENEFGQPSNYNKYKDTKYKNKWDNIYKKMVEKSPILREAHIQGQDDFCDNYQINRNIAFARENDYVLFLTPKANRENKINNGRDYIENLHNPQIKNLYWEEIMDWKEITEKAMTVEDDFSEFRKYYAKFYDKYIKFLA